jgi:ECF sigma factor
MSEIIHLMDAVAAGDRQAVADMLPLVYDELRKLAAAKMAAKSPGHTLTARPQVHIAGAARSPKRVRYSVSGA